MERVANKEQEKRFDVEEWEGEIKTIIQKDGGEGPYIITDLWRAIHSHNMNGHPSDYEAKRVGRVLRRMGYRKTSREFENVQKKCWVKNHMVKV